MVCAEQQRLDEADKQGIGWRRWGPYRGERQWAGSTGVVAVLPLLLHGDIGAWVRPRGQAARHGRETAGAS